MKVVVIGGTGMIGSRLVTKLGEAGHDVVAASPATGVDTLTSEGLAEALAGASAVVDVSNSPSMEAAPAMEFFTTSTGNLLAAGSDAGVEHHVVLSIVGADRATESGYYRAKVAQERLVESSASSFTNIHATQFFEFVDGIANAATVAGEVRLPHALIQPIAADDLAAAMRDVTQGRPANGVVEVAGPEPFHMDEIVRERLRAQDDPRSVVADPRARYFGAELEERTLMPGPGARLGATRFADWAARSPARA